VPGTERHHRPLLVPLALAVPPRVLVSEPSRRRLDFPVRTSGHQAPPTPLRCGPHRHRRSDAPPTRRLVMSTASPAVPGFAEESPERQPRAAPSMSPRRGRTRPRALPAAAPLPREDQTATRCDRPPTTTRTQHPRRRAPLRARTSGAIPGPRCRPNSPNFTPCLRSSPSRPAATRTPGTWPRHDRGYLPAPLGLTTYRSRTHASANRPQRHIVRSHFDLLSRLLVEMDI